MLIKKIYSLMFFALSLTICVIHSSMPPMGAGFNPNMSEEELLNQLMQEINSALPEDQREAFWQEVARETERLEQETAHMAPEEKEQYLMNLIAAETGPETETPVIPQPQKPIEKEVQKPAKPTVTAAKTDEIMTVISQIVTLIESFITKAAAFPDFDGKALGWVAKGRITDWQADSWSTFQHDLNKLVHTLQRFKDKDVKIGLKHLDELAKNETLVQSLRRLQSKLNEYEPTIKVTPFEIASMSESTKNASIHVINTLTDVLYRNKINPELQKIIELFDPTAKKIREEEEKAAKTALAGRRPEVTVPVRTAGRPERRTDFALPSFDDFGLDGDGRGMPSYQPSKKPSEETGSSIKDKDKKETGKTGASGTKGVGGTKGGKTEEDKKKAEEQKKKPTEVPAPQIKHPKVKKNIDDLLRKDIEEALAPIRETPEFQSNASLKEYLLPAA